LSFYLPTVIFRYQIIKVEASTNQGFKNFVCDDKRLDFEYLYYLLQFLKPVFESLIPRSSKYKKINSSAIQAFKIPVPPLKKQKEIAKK